MTSVLMDIYLEKLAKEKALEKVRPVVDGGTRIQLSDLMILGDGPSSFKGYLLSVDSLWESEWLEYSRSFTEEAFAKLTLHELAKITDDLVSKFNMKNMKRVWRKNKWVMEKRNP